MTRVEHGCISASVRNWKTTYVLFYLFFTALRDHCSVLLLFYLGSDLRTRDFQINLGPEGRTTVVSVRWGGRKSKRKGLTCPRLPPWLERQALTPPHSVSSLLTPGMTEGKRDWELRRSRLSTRSAMESLWDLSFILLLLLPPALLLRFSALKLFLVQL